RAAGEYRRRNIFELYIEEVAEACNRLKGGTLKTEKLKAQLQKIATSRTGGMKTDEALGKTGGGPEGLPDSIIVTPEGVEGEVAIAVDATNAIAQDAAPIADTPAGKVLLVEKPIEKRATSTANVKYAKPAQQGKAAKGKAAQLVLFSGTSPASRSARAKTKKAGKNHKARGKK
ncbi:MAG TPA: DNA topoisomerase VI subunit B, partial [Nitrospiraceae bacterium]